MGISAPSVNATIRATGVASINAGSVDGILEAGGNISLTASEILYEEIVAPGDIYVNMNFGLADLTVDVTSQGGSATVYGVRNVTADITAKGQIEISRCYGTVSGRIQAASDVKIYSYASITGAVIAGDEENTGSAYLTVVDNVSGPIQASGDIFIEAGLTVYFTNVPSTGEGNVSGPIQAAGNVFINARGVVSGSVSASGNVTISAGVVSGNLQATGSIFLTAPGPSTIPSIQAGAVAFQGGNFSVSGSYGVNTTSVWGSTVSLPGTLTLPNLVLGKNGVLRGASVTVGEKLVWTAGTLEVGTTEIGSNATLVISEEPGAGTWNKKLGTDGGASRTLINRGKVLWYDGDIALYNSTWENQGTFKIFADKQLWGTNSLLINSGTIRKQKDDQAVSQGPDAPPQPGDAMVATSDGETRLSITMQNTGNLEAYTGSLAVSWLTNSGRIALAENTKLVLRATAAFNAGSTIRGVTNDDPTVEEATYLNPAKIGVISIAGGRDSQGNLSFDGDMQVNTDLTIHRLELLEDGKISGGYDLTITGYLDWRGGRMEATGLPRAQTKLTQGAILFVNGDQNATISGRILNNLGRVAWSVNTGIFVAGGAASNANRDIRNSAASVNDWTYKRASQNAGNTYLDDISLALRGTTSPQSGDPANGGLLYYEQQQDTLYTQGVEPLADQYANRVAAAEKAYNDALPSNDPPDDPQAQEDYWDNIAQAEETHDAALVEAGRQYYEAENALYNDYQYWVNYNGRTFQNAIDAALARFRESLWNAAPVAQGWDIDDIVRYANFQLHPPQPGQPGDPPLGPNPPPASFADYLASFTADVRASIMTAYAVRYGVTLEADISASLSDSAAGQAITALYSGTVPELPQSVWGQMANWVGSGVTWFGNAFTGVVDAVRSFDIDAAWQGLQTFVTNTAEMMVTDPLGFVQSVGNGIINTTAVVGNQFTFGLVPGLNSYADQLVANNGFYRFVNVGAVVGREIVVGMATGGAANLAIGGAIRAGRVAGNLLTRAGAAAIPNAISRAAPAIACRLTSVQRLVQPAQAYYNIGTMANNFGAAGQAIASGDYETAAALIARSGGMIRGTLSAVRDTGRLARAATGLGGQNLRDYLRACFAAGTPILWEGGVKNVEDFRVGDRVWARDENDPHGPLQLKEIEECFDVTGRVWHLHIGGQVIRTTDEHPFWVEGKGWTPTCELQIGDRLTGQDGQARAVEDILDTGEYETVYNFRVADHHTYFVGDSGWGFSVWAHNVCVKTRYDRNWNERTAATNPNVKIYGTAQRTGNNLHAWTVEQEANRIAATLPEGSYITLNRSWNTALGGGTPSITQLNNNIRRRPDIIVVENLGNGRQRVRAIEVRSPGQSESDLRSGLDSGWNSFGRPVMLQRGRFDVI